MMKQKKFFIYLTTNLVNGKQYIGQHYGFEDDKYLGSGILLTKAIEKYGVENFNRTILCFCENELETNQKEIEYIKKFQAVESEMFYNISAGGRTGNATTLNQGKEKWQKEHPEEHQKQVDKWRKMGTEANSQKIRCITTGEIFPSQCEAARQYKIPQGNISKCLKGERKSAGKHPITQKKLFWEIV